MSTDLSIPETMIARRLYTSATVHLIDTKAPEYPGQTHRSSLCGVRPIWPGVWIEPDTEFAGSLCGTCLIARGATERVTDA